MIKMQSGQRNVDTLNDWTGIAMKHIVANAVIDVGRRIRKTTFVTGQVISKC